MKLVFTNGKKSDCTVLKETKKYMFFRCKGNTMKYRYNKETQEVQDGTYHNALKGMKVEL